MPKLWIKVVPAARQNRVERLLADRLQIWLTSRPEKNQANEELQRYLAAGWGLRRNQIKIVAGLKSRLKLVEVESEFSTEELVRIICLRETGNSN
jgi:uncharacterized protein YggU (UPF0235/DUF167 family)